MYKNKSNIEIVRSYVNGERPFIQVGYTGESKYKKEGEKWTDKDGVEWEKKNGKNVRLTKTQGDLIRGMIKQTCKCGQDIRWGSKLDQKFYNKTGLCENCLIDYETKLHILGIYDEYEKYKLISNEIGYLREAKEKLKEVVEYFSQENCDVEMICNSQGFIERWKTTNKDQILKDAKNDLKTVRHRISALSKIKKELKSKYIESASKYNLEIYGR